MLYLDTSVLVAALTNEAETERMQDWLGRQQADELAISDWVMTEFSSALSIKLRTGQIGAAHRATASAAFARLAADSFTVVPVSRLQYGGSLRRAADVGLACWRCLAPRGVRRSWGHALHTGPSPERRRLGARCEDAPSLTPAPSSAAPCIAESPRQPGCSRHSDATASRRQDINSGDGVSNLSSRDYPRRDP